MTTRATIATIAVGMVLAAVAAVAAQAGPGQMSPEAYQALHRRSVALNVIYGLGKPAGMTHAQYRASLIRSAALNERYGQPVVLTSDEIARLYGTGRTRSPELAPPTNSTRGFASIGPDPGPLRLRPDRGGPHLTGRRTAWRGVVASATPLHAARLLPPPGKGACGISAGWKRRAAPYENENSLQNPDSRAGSTRDPWRPAVFVPTRATKDVICRYFTGATGLEPATSGVTGRSWHFRVERG